MQGDNFKPADLSLLEYSREMADRPASTAGRRGCWGGAVKRQSMRRARATSDVLRRMSSGHALPYLAALRLTQRYSTECTQCPNRHRAYVTHACRGVHPAYFPLKAQRGRNADDGRAVGADELASQTFACLHVVGHHVDLYFAATRYADLPGWLIICRMIDDLDETRIRTLEQVHAVLDGLQTLDLHQRSTRKRVGRGSFGAGCTSACRSPKRRGRCPRSWLHRLSYRRAHGTPGVRESPRPSRSRVAARPGRH